MQYLNFPPGYLQINFGKNGLQSINFDQEIRKDSIKSISPEKKRLLSQLRRYFCKRKTNFRVKIDWQSIPDFTRKVLEETKQIPYGEVRSYQEIAKRLGQEQSARAVGQALGKNPMPIVIPCHRVVKSDGGLGGFGWGVQWKKRLLELEGWTVVEGKISR